MSTTEVYTRLEEAVSATLEVEGKLGEGQFVQSFLVIVALDQMDRSDGTGQYHLTHPPMQQPHINLGLLDIAADMVINADADDPD